MIVPNTARDLLCHVVTLADGLDKTSGTIYAYVRRDSDGYFLKADNTWASGAPTGADLPTGTYVAQGIWKKNLSAAVTNALTAGDSVSCRMTDHETPASATVTSDVAEHLVDALTNTRSTYAGGAVASVTGAVGSVAGQTLANLDAAVSSRLAPTTAGRTLDVSAAGEAGIDWANVGSPTTNVDLSGTTIASEGVWHDD